MPGYDRVNFPNLVELKREAPKTLLSLKLIHHEPVSSVIDTAYCTKSLQQRKRLPQMFAASISIRSESGAPITTPILLEGGFFFV